MAKRQKIKLSELWAKVDFTRPSTWMLIFSNVIVIFFAIVDNLSALEVLWIYWIQSVIIGVFNFVKIISLKEFSTKNFRSSGKELQATKATKISTGIFFLFHYGFFHVVYAMFIGGFSEIGKTSTSGSMHNYLWFTSLVFFVSYLIEYIQSLRNPPEEIPNLGAVMFAPYLRIIPMHITIVLGGFIGIIGSFFNVDINYSIILLFVSIKTFVDLLTHSVDFNSLSTQLSKQEVDN
jgi:hypothetical protein